MLTVYAGNRSRHAGANRGLARGRLPHAGLHDVAHDHFVDLRRVDLRALDRRADGGGAELGRGERRDLLLSRLAASRTASVPASASRFPMTAMYGTFMVSASRMR